MAFAQNFSYCLDQTGLSPYAFAQIIGVSNQGVLNWKKGVSLPYPKTQQKIANYFGITVEVLMGDELPVLPPKGTKKAPATDGEGDANLARFVDGFMRLTLQQKDAVLALIKGFLQDQA